MINVLQIEVCFFLRRMVFTKSVYLRLSGQAGFDAQPPSLPDGVMLYSLWRFGPRPHQGHLSSDYVPERSEEHTSELQSQSNLVCRLLLEKKKKATWCRRRLRNSESILAEWSISRES